MLSSNESISNSHGIGINMFCVCVCDYWEATAFNKVYLWFQPVPLSPRQPHIFSPPEFVNFCLAFVSQMAMIYNSHRCRICGANASQFRDEVIGFWLRWQRWMFSTRDAAIGPIDGALESLPKPTNSHTFDARDVFWSFDTHKKWNKTSTKHKKWILHRGRFADFMQEFVHFLWLCRRNCREREIFVHLQSPARTENRSDTFDVQIH